MRMFPLVVLSLLSACAEKPASEQEIPATTVETPNEESADTDVDRLPQPRGEVFVIPVAAFMPPQVVLDEHPSFVGETETFTADAVIHADDITLAADGLVYEITPDIDGVVAADFIHWCMLSEIHGGGEFAPDVVPVDIASSIDGNLVRFDYAFTGERSFVLTCSFGRTEETIGFNAALVEILEPTLLPSGNAYVTYAGTNMSDVDRTVYLAP